MYDWTWLPVQNCFKKAQGCVGSSSGYWHLSLRQEILQTIGVWWMNLIHNSFKVLFQQRSSILFVHVIGLSLCNSHVWGNQIFCSNLHLYFVFIIRRERCKGLYCHYTLIIYLSIYIYIILRMLNKFLLIKLVIFIHYIFKLLL